MLTKTKKRLFRLALAVSAGYNGSAFAFQHPSLLCNFAALRLRPLNDASSDAALSMSVPMMDDSIVAVASVNEDNDSDENDDSELALLLPRQTLRIQIGDTSSSRKAWKKRRRNSSPILIPCSVLGMNREWMVRWNVMTLLHMVGEETSAAGAGGTVAATAGKIGRAYRQRLGGNLRDHSKALGHDSVESLLQTLFDERMQAEYGIRTFVDPNHGNLMLATALTRRQARSFSSSAGMVRFRPETQDGGHVIEGNLKMIHTGMASVRLPSSIGRMPKFATEPLGAALRVSPYDEAAQRYEEGDEFNAFVYSYDAQGDNESPLLVLTADDPRGKGVALAGTGTFGSSTRVFKRRNIKGGNFEDASIERELNSLTSGDGPFDATVVAVSPHSNAVFVDCGVGRKRGKKFGGGVIKVLGMLRLEDIKRDERTLTMEEKDFGMEAGDEIKVYVKAVSPQSGRFMVTLDPSVKNKKAKDIKLEKQAEKRKGRLEKQISQDDIETLIGNVYEGVVKATSNAGDWYYVQPRHRIDGGGGGREAALPVGVANFSHDAEGQGGGRGPYSTGDQVRVRVEGIDNKRGQLALLILD